MGSQPLGNSRAVARLERRQRLLCLFLWAFFCTQPLLAQDDLPPLEVWQSEFLDHLKGVYQAGRPSTPLRFSDYAIDLQLSTPEQLRQTVNKRVTVYPYRGSMAEPAAVLMGGKGNGLDRARLLLALLENAGHEGRIMHTTAKPGYAEVTYLSRNPAPLYPIAPDMLASIEWQVQSLSPKAWQRVCGKAVRCDDWFAQAKEGKNEQQVYWVQVSANGAWQNLVPADTRMSDEALNAGMALTDAALKAQRWNIRITVSNQLDGVADPQIVLDIARPAGAIHGLPISYDNVPNSGSKGFVPTLQIGDGTPLTGTPFEVAGIAAVISRQLLTITVTGPSETRSAR